MTICTAGRASQTESMSQLHTMQSALVEISLKFMCPLTSQAEQAKMGRHFRAAPISWAHIIVTGPIYCCSKRPLISRPETRRALVFQSGSWARRCSMRISTAGAYRALRSKAHLGICTCPFFPAIRRGILQLWSSFLNMEGHFCAALMSGLSQAQGPGY